MELYDNWLLLLCLAFPLKVSIVYASVVGKMPLWLWCGENIWKYENFGFMWKIPHKLQALQCQRRISTLVYFKLKKHLRFFIFFFKVDSQDKSSLKATIHASSDEKLSIYDIKNSSERRRNVQHDLNPDIVVEQTYESEFFMCSQNCMMTFYFRDDNTSLRGCISGCSMTVMENKIQDIEHFKDEHRSSPALETIQCAYKCLNIQNISKTLQCYTECLLEEKENEEETTTNAPTTSRMSTTTSKLIIFFIF